MDFTAKQLDIIEHALNVARLDCEERAPTLSCDRTRAEFERYAKAFGDLSCYIENTRPCPHTP